MDLVRTLPDAFLPDATLICRFWSLWQAAKVLPAMRVMSGESEQPCASFEALWADAVGMNRRSANKLDKIESFFMIAGLRGGSLYIAPRDNERYPALTVYLGRARVSRDW